MGSVDDLGHLSYQKAVWDDYQGAIDILNIAISKFPNDARLYNNRCYCYCHLRDFKRALQDADYLVKAFPKYIKSHYRRGEVFYLLRNYEEAETEFKEVLLNHPTCEEAKYRVKECQLLQVQQVGCHRFVAMKALQMTGGTYQAKQLLESGASKYIANEEEIYYSDEEVSPDTETYTGDPYTDPRNLMNSKTLWVGNVTKKVTEEKLKRIFKQYGQILSIVVQYKNFCAFVNYTSPEMASNAMQKFEQNTPVGDTKLVIRFPDKLPPLKSSVFPARR